MSYLELTSLKKSYGTTLVLKDLSLSIERGEFVSLLGASGSGKTTALRCIAGLEAPDSGAIRLGGKTLSGPEGMIAPEKRNLGMVFQNYAVWPHMDVASNVAFPLTTRKGLSKSEITSKVKAALSLVRLEGLEHRYSNELSGGQQQRVALARALAMSPDALLLDEPLSNLDALLREELASEIRRLQQELQLTTILVTHDRKEALSMSDRIVLLNHGVIEASGTPEDLYLRPPTPFAASFISGAQRLDGAGGDTLVLPRRWRVSETGSEYRVLSRLFLGNEYEYWAQARGDGPRIRFFAATKHEITSVVRLHYAAD